jgi:hypothetical protein
MSVYSTCFDIFLDFYKPFYQKVVNPVVLPVSCSSVLIIIIIILFRKYTLSYIGKLFPYRHF